jgi:hypothetical protein
MPAKRANPTTIRYKDKIKNSPTAFFIVLNI